MDFLILIIHNNCIFAYYGYPQVNGAERRSERKSGARVLIPPGYLYRLKRKH
jgi:hypothetical protein